MANRAQVKFYRTPQERVSWYGCCKWWWFEKIPSAVWKIAQRRWKNATDLTQDDCNYWVEKLIEFFSQQKVDVVIEGTMRRSEIVLDTIRLLAERNYNMETRTITVPFEISRASIFIAMKSKKHLGIKSLLGPRVMKSLLSVLNTLRAIFNSPDILRMQLSSRRESEYE